jgi:hypothetical protein
MRLQPGNDLFRGEYLLPVFAVTAGGRHGNRAVRKGLGKGIENNGPLQKISGRHGELVRLRMVFGTGVDEPQLRQPHVLHCPAHHADIAGALGLHEDNRDSITERHSHTLSY